MLGILDDEQIETVLRTGSVGRLGYRDRDQVAVVPFSYAYANHSVYGHYAEGRKLTAMRRNPEVGFEVEDVHGLDDWNPRRHRPARLGRWRHTTPWPG